MAKPSTRSLLRLAGLEPQAVGWLKALPIAAGIGVGLLAGAVMAATLLTPPGPKRLTRGVKQLWGAEGSEEPMHSDPPMH